MTAHAVRIRWTPADMPDVRGLHFVVTGGNSGLGLVTARELARAGAKVTLTSRSASKGEAALAAISQAIGAELAHANVTVASLDLASLASIQEFAQSLSGSAVDCLINNAGVMAPPLARTADGFELQFGTNHLGHFALTARLWDSLMRSDRPRVVTLASNAHKPGKIDFTNLNAEKSYSAWGAYMQSKLANLLFAFELERRAAARGHVAFSSVAAHPGYSATNLSASVAPGIGGPLRSLTNRIESVIGQSADMGALPQLYAATSIEIPGGAYAGPDGWGEWRGYPRLVTPNPIARSESLGAELWRVSEELTHVSFL
ncbi:MAG: hypothetical protein RL441_514 [Actinomycetota bacterium]